MAWSGFKLLVRFVSDHRLHRLPPPSARAKRGVQSMNRRLSRFLAAALVAVCGAAMLAATFDAEARRMGGGGSFGRQSANVATKRQATPPAAAPTAGATQRPGATAAAAGTGAAAGATAGRSAASRWFGPIA